MVLGYRDSDLFLKEEFTRYASVYVSTEDGSVGTKGNVIDAIRANELESRHNLCLRTNADASRSEGICGREEDRGTDIHGGENGVRHRCMSGMCLPVYRCRRTQSCT